jgi:hypothetical protein
MDRHAFQSIVYREICLALDDLLPDHAPAAQVPRAALERRLEVVCERVAATARTYYLHGLKTVDEIAEEIGVERERLREIAAERHQRFGVGRKLGDAWVWAPDEVDVVRPGGE